MTSKRMIVVPDAVHLFENDYCCGILVVMKQPCKRLCKSLWSRGRGLREPESISPAAAWVHLIFME